MALEKDKYYEVELISGEIVQFKYIGTVINNPNEIVVEINGEIQPLSKVIKGGFKKYTEIAKPDK